MSILSESATSIGSQTIQSVALELVIFCVTIFLAIVVKVCSSKSVHFLNFWPGRRASPTKFKTSSRDDYPPPTTRSVPKPHAEEAAATRTRKNVHAATVPLDGAARTMDAIMRMGRNKEAADALALYGQFTSKEDKHDWKAALQTARRSGTDFYSVLVQSAVSIGKPDMVEKLLDDMASSQFERTLSFYESVMKVLAGRKHYRQALAVYSRLSSEGLKASPVTLSCLVNFAAELGDLDSAIKFFEQLDATSTPSIRAYMVALRVHSKRQDWIKSLEIVRSMQARNVSIDSLILNTVLATGVASDKTEAAEELLHELATTVPEVPDVISYNTVLKGYACQKVADKALKVLDLMLSRGLKPNGITFNTVMDAAVRGSQIESAWKVLDFMQEAGICPDKYTCTILMKGLQENSTPKQLTRLIEMIRTVLPQCDSPLSSALFHGIIQVCSRFNNTALLMRAFNQMQGRYITPSAADYQLMIETLAQAGDNPNCSTIWKAVLSSTGKIQQQSSEALVAAICKSVMENLAQKEQVEAMVCAFESLASEVPAREAKKRAALVDQCRASLIQAASRKQHSSPAFRRLLELAPEQGVSLDALTKSK